MAKRQITLITLASYLRLEPGVIVQNVLLHGPNGTTLLMSNGAKLVYGPKRVVPAVQVEVKNGILTYSPGGKPNGPLGSDGI